MEKVTHVVWMNQPSHYQTVFFWELASRPGVKLHVIYGEGLARERRALGWSEPKPESFPQTILPPGLIAALPMVLRLAWQHRHAAHLLNGLWSVRPFMVASLVLRCLGTRVFFHSERPNPRSPIPQPGLTLKRLWTAWLFTAAEGIFVIGRRAGEFYHSMGAPIGKILPFLYFTNPGAAPVARERRRPQIVYVGQFVPRKRVGDLVEAFGRLAARFPDHELLLLGAGPDATLYRDLAAKLGLSERVKLRGPLPPAEVAAEVASSQLLVLPSDFDGWGLTVNEALQVGVPAVCSDRCGVAQVLASHPDWGRVSVSGDVESLAEAIQTVLSQPARYAPDALEVSRAIGPSVWTDYFIACTGTRSANLSLV